MKITTPEIPSAAKIETGSAQRQKRKLHIRLPQRSDKVEGNEADIASASTDPRTASQDPCNASRIQLFSPKEE